jgi:hypothetical protein
MTALYAFGVWLCDASADGTDDADTFSDADSDSIVGQYCSTLTEDEWRVHSMTFCEHLATCDPSHIVSMDAAHLRSGRPLLHPELFETVVERMAQQLHAHIATAAQTSDTEQLDMFVALAAGAQRILDRLREGEVTL